MNLPATPSKSFAPATERNREPIAAVLRDLLPRSGTILEIASGTGEHIVHFARLFPQLRWQPSDPDADALRSIAAWRDEAQLPNLAEPIFLDASAADWPIASADSILCVNMVHISPWAATIGLMRGAARLLPPNAPLILYGPYIQAALPTAPSNLAFDQSLRARNSEWGLRTVEAVAGEAEASGLRFERSFEMPANNLILLFRQTG